MDNDKIKGMVSREYENLVAARVLQIVKVANA